MKVEKSSTPPGPFKPQNDLFWAAEQSPELRSDEVSLLNLDEICFDLAWMVFHKAEARHLGGSVDRFVGENSPAQYLNFDSNSRDSFGSSVEPCSDRAVFSNNWPRYGYNYEADGILGGHPMTESQPDQQHHQPCLYHSNDAPASAVPNENSSDSTSQGLVGLYSS